MLDTTEPQLACNCENEGWCTIPGTTRFRVSLPFSDDHTIVFPDVLETTEDRTVANHRAEFERKPGAFAFLWGTDDPRRGVPEQSATAFPISPPAAGGGGTIWASTRHSCDPFSYHFGFYANNNAFYRAVKDRATTFNKIAVHRTPHNPSVFTCSVDNALLFKLPGTSAAEVDFALYRANTDPAFFWIPDPTPLVVGDEIAVLGNPGAFGSGASGDLSARFLENLFLPGTKSISSGTILGVNESVLP
jgi:hypothetical protein